MEEVSWFNRFAGLLTCFFFFSSRRRHTRLQGDWSSDVCSSDLKGWETVFASIPDGTDAQICFQVGQYPLDTPVIVTGKGNLKLVGCGPASMIIRSEEHTSELQSPCNLVCRLLLEKKKHIKT